MTSKGEAKEVWVVAYAQHDGEQLRQHIKTFARTQDADAYHATVKVGIRAGVHTSGNHTVAEAGAKWIDDAEDRLEPATVESYRQHLDDHIIPFIGTVKLSQLTVPLGREFMDRLRSQKRSPDMIKRGVGDLVPALPEAQERGW